LACFLAHAKACSREEVGAGELKPFTIDFVVDEVQRVIFMVLLLDYLCFLSFTSVEVDCSEVDKPKNKTPKLLQHSTLFVHSVSFRDFNLLR
jgi:hypothetical protein